MLTKHSRIGIIVLKSNFLLNDRQSFLSYAVQTCLHPYPNIILLRIAMYVELSSLVVPGV